MLGVFGLLFFENCGAAPHENIEDLRVTCDV